MMPQDAQGRPTTQAVEDYVKAIYHLGGAEQPVSTTALADWLHISPAGTSHMLRQLAQLGLVDHTPYYGVRLTETGNRAALEVIRHHRLAEQFLVQVLGYAWDEVHEDAERLEHAMSERLEERIADKLGNPAADPHGDPIPTLAGQVPASPERRLADLPAGVAALVRRVSDRDPAKLRYLAELGLTPGAEGTILARGPFREPLRLRVGAEERTISQDLAAELTVDPLSRIAS
jgi:DtxR family transcriptional regulator, Mn-dependent transcriptional regulator